MHTDPVTGQMVADPSDSLAPGIAPGQVASTETAGTSTSRGALVPAAQARLAAGRTVEQQAAAGLVDETQKAGQLAEQKARAEQEKANREAAVSAEYNQRRLAAMDQADKDLQAARANHKQAFDDYRKMEIVPFFADKDPATGATKTNVGRMVLAAITVGLGGLNQRYNGGRNTALEQLDKTIDGYFAREREKILRAKDDVNEAKGMEGDVISRQTFALKNLDIKEAAARANIADQMKVKLADLGVPAAQIESNKAVLEQQQKAAEKLQKVDDSERTHIVATHTKALQAPGVGQVFGPGGQPLVDVGDKVKAKDINAAIANAREMKASIRELAELDQKGLSVPLVGETAQRREALRSSILLKAKEQAKLGALSGGDMSIMESQLGGKLSDSTGMGRGARLDEMGKLLDRGTAAFLDSQGLAGSKLMERVGVTGAAAPPEGRAPAKPAAAAKPAPGGGLSTQDQAKLRLHLKRNPNDPRAADIRAALGM